MDRTRSLKLLEMPLLYKKLGFNSNVDGGRITGIVDLGYNDKVLVGHWRDKRFEGPVNTELDLQTTYNEDYQGRPGVPDRQSIWDNRIQGQRSLQLKQGRESEYQDNLTTVYDLAYRCKVRDFLDGNYGNCTNYGTRECLQNYWTNQKYDRRNQYHTAYSDSFSFYQCKTHITM